MGTPYIRFLKLIDTLDGFSDLNPLQHFMVKKMVVMWGRREKVTVTQVLHFNQLASPSTLHRELNKLKEKGYLSLKTNAIDRRIKEVLPTSKLNKLNASFEVALNKSLLA